MDIEINKDLPPPPPMTDLTEREKQIGALVEVREYIERMIERAAQ